MPNYIIEAFGLVKNYRIDGRSVEVLKGVDLNLSRSEKIAIVGPSGAGKSTLLHLVGLLEPQTEGRLLFDSQDVSKLSDAERSRIRLERIGFVFQFHHLLSEFTSLENTLLPGLISGVDQSDCRRKASELLKNVGLSHRLDHKPGELSGGEQQRVAFARALMNDPELILADEPTGNLDRQSSSQLSELLNGICSDRGTALLIVTHNKDLADTADRIISMADGRLDVSTG